MDRLRATIDQKLSREGIYYDSFYRVNSDFRTESSPLGAIFRYFFSIFLTDAGRFIDLKSASVLSVGCGSGEFESHLSQYVRSITGVDVSRTGIEVAIKRKIKNTRFSVADATMLPYKNSSYDIVLFQGVLHHIKHWQKAISEAQRVLKPGGCLIAIEPSKRSVVHFVGKHIFPNRYHSHQSPDEHPMDMATVNKCLRDFGLKPVRQRTVDFFFSSLSFLFPSMPRYIWMPLYTLNRMLISIPIINAAGYVIAVSARSMKKN